MRKPFMNVDKKIIRIAAGASSRNLETRVSLLNNARDESHIIWEKDRWKVCLL